MTKELDLRMGQNWRGQHRMCRTVSLVQFGENNTTNKEVKNKKNNHFSRYFQVENCMKAAELQLAPIIDGSI